MTPSEAAREAGLTRRTIMRAIAENQLRASRTGRVARGGRGWQITPAQLARWLHRRETDAVLTDERGRLQCSRCHRYKAPSEFRPDATARRGYHRRCRDCQKELRRQYEATPERRAARKAHKGRTKETLSEEERLEHNAATRAWRNENHRLVLAKARATRRLLDLYPRLFDRLVADELATLADVEELGIVEVGPYTRRLFGVAPADDTLDETG